MSENINKDFGETFLMLAIQPFIILMWIRDKIRGR